MGWKDILKLRNEDNFPKWSSEGYDADPVEYPKQYTRENYEWYMKNPLPPLSRDDFPEIKELMDKHGEWPPPIKDYPDLSSDEEWEEFHDWERYVRILSQMKIIHEEEKKINDKDAKDKQEWDDIVAEGKELGIYISQGEIKEQDTEAMRRRVEAVRR